MRNLRTLGTLIGGGILAAVVAWAGVSLAIGQPASDTAVELTAGSPEGASAARSDDDSDARHDDADDEEHDSSRTDSTMTTNTVGSTSSTSDDGTSTTHKTSTTNDSTPSTTDTTSTTQHRTNTSEDRGTTSTSHSSTSSTGGGSDEAVTKVFNLQGGSTAISFSPSGVEVLWATPNDGYNVKIEPEYPGLKVEFRSDAHRSRVDAWWNGGPQHEIRERED